MRRERWFGAAIAALLSFGVALGSVCCLSSGMDMPVDMKLLLPVLVLGAMIAAACSAFRLHWVPLGLTVVAGAVSLQPLLKSVRSLLQQIFATYQKAYHWTSPDWIHGSATDATLALCLVGMLLICAVVAAAMSGRGIGAAVLACALPVLPCCIVTDRVPDETYLYLLLFSALMLLMSQHVRRRGFARWAVATLYLVLPVALGLGLLFRLLPQEGYRLDKDAYNLKNDVLEAIQEQEWFSELASDVIEEQLYQQEAVDLEAVKENPELDLTVMSVKVPTSGYLYLRGSSYDTYTGLGWENSGVELPNVYPVQGQTQYITIRTKYVLDVLYLPYVAEALPGTIQNGRLYNYDGVREYNLAYRALAEFDPSWDQPDGYAFDEAVAKTCLQLPEQTRLWAAQTVPASATSLLAAGKVQAAALQIGQYVRRSAAYDRMTGAMPAGQEDFVRWFLEDSDKGYCIHFASAAVVLLRAAGIPARYVTGYVVAAEKDLFVDVTTSQAHAWAEYYVPEVGWTVLEVTPAEGENYIHSETPDTIATVPVTTEVPGTESGGTTEPTRPQAPAEPEASAPDGLWILFVVLILISIPAQWQLRLSLRKQKKSTGSTNARLLVRWREAEQLCRLQKARPPEVLHQLAQKARFSQHTITRQELLFFDGKLEEMRRGLKRHPWYMQLVYRLVFALY